MKTLKKFALLGKIIEANKGDLRALRDLATPRSTREDVELVLLRRMVAAKAYQQALDAYKAQRRAGAVAEARELAKRAARDGAIFVAYWSRDCDAFESLSFHAIPTVGEFYQWRDAAVGDAEGPCRVEVISPEEYAEAVREEWGFERDRALEAFEEGRGRLVYI